MSGQRHRQGKSPGTCSTQSSKNSKTNPINTKPAHANGPSLSDLLKYEHIPRNGSSIIQILFRSIMNSFYLKKWTQITSTERGRQTCSSACHAVIRCSGGISPLILSGCEWSVSRPGRLIPPEAGLATQPVWTFRKEKNHSPLQGIEPR